MSTNSETLFEAFLNQHDDESWEKIVTSLLPHIHEVDRTATQIWLKFYPLALERAFQQAEDPDRLAFELQMLGSYRLRHHLDSSHHFLYGHRYWPEVKQAIAAHARSAKAPASLDLATQIRDLAADVAAKAGVDKSLLVGITAVGFMALENVGLEAFAAAPGSVVIDAKHARKTAEQVLRSRAKDDAQGLFGFLKGPEKFYTVTFNENQDGAGFKLINTQHLTTAAAGDKRDYVSRDSRCMAGEGPIPIQCRSAACGTCWVGVLGGAEKMSDVGQLEERRIKEFGYIDTNDPKPLIRLACMAQAFGAVSIVIPPWNGVFGKFLKRRKIRTAEAQKGLA